MTKGELVRALIFKKPIRWMKVPAVNRQAYAELGRVGNNINQAVKLANRYGSELNARDFEELNALLHSVRLELLGVSDDR